MTQTTRIHGGDFNYCRLLDIMQALMCWNWDFSMDTCCGILTIHGYNRADFIINAIEDRGELIPEDLEFELGTESTDVILKVNTLK